MPYQQLPCNQVVRLYTHMRSAWDEHVALTRMLIISFAAGLPDFEFVKYRLLQNPAEIARVFGQYVSPETAAQIQQLLYQHLVGSVPVLQAAKANDQVALANAVAAWRANGMQVAAALAQVTALPYDSVNALVQQHLNTTIAEALARIKGQWDLDTAAYDKVRRHVISMADQLSTGLLNNLPTFFY